MNTVDVSSMMKDLYPLPGTRIKQWVIDRRREATWVRETCPTFMMLVHDDNTGVGCRNSGSANYEDLAHHDCCYQCNEYAETLADDPKVLTWLHDKSLRPPVEQDHSKLSDEIEPNHGLELHPILKALLPK